MNIIKFENKDEFVKYVQNEAHKILKEEKIQNLGIPIDLKMNQKDGSKNSTGAQIDTKGKIKTTSPSNLPREFKATKDSIDIDMEERDGGHDEEISTATKIEGAKSQKGETDTNPYIKGQAKPNIESKKNQPNISVDADPTKEGGVPGKKENDVSMNKEDKEDKTDKPMTQVLGKGEISKNGFSKGQIDKNVNIKAQNEIDTYEQKLRDSIKTIQLPEGFKNKKEMYSFIMKEAVKMSKIISEDFYSSGMSEDEYLTSPEYFVETYFNGNFSQLKEMLIKFIQLHRMKELRTYLDDGGYEKIKNWIIDNI